MLVTIPTNFLWSAFSFLTLSNFEGILTLRWHGPVAQLARAYD
jgi:hypothetical protein